MIQNEKKKIVFINYINNNWNCNGVLFLHSKFHKRTSQFLGY